MSMLPEAKLDILLAHHASLEARSLGKLSSEEYVRITRELAELNPLISAVKAYRAVEEEIADIDALISAVLEFGAQRSSSDDSLVLKVEPSPPLAM